MSEHPIEGLMLTAMNSIKDMIDVNTIIGDPIQAANNIVVIPISKVSFGFTAGGSEFKGETVNQYKKQERDEQIEYRLPFGGGAGAGISLSPVAFLVIQGEMVKLLPVNHSTSLDKILDYIPDLFEKASCMINKSISNKKEQTDKIISTIQKKCKKENEPNGKVKKKIKTEELEDKVDDEELEDIEELKYKNVYDDEEFDEYDE